MVACLRGKREDDESDDGYVKKRTQIRNLELFPLQLGQDYYNNLQILCYFLRVQIPCQKN